MRLWKAKRLFLFAALAAAAPAPAYYHFVHYLTSGNAPEKFDLNALTAKTVTFFVSGTPSTLTGTDTFNSVLSQLRQATVTWNGVSTSALRVAFGGLENGTTLQGTPGGDIVFEDLPPGVYGFGGPTSTASPVVPANGASFVPISRSAIHLNRNLTLQPGPSYRETFFLTAVHEMGHALGLQHTFTSATMSQATTRATTLSHPLDADDIAGISVLYPNAAFAQFGSISGRVTIGGRPAHLVSVVAIRAGSGAVSTLTNADGTYRIEGIPANHQYFIYAHSLPPDADVRVPLDANGNPVAASGPTDALFYPGTRDLLQIKAVSVEAGKVFGGVDIDLTSRASLPVYDTQVFGYFNNYTIAAQPAYVNMLGNNSTVVASGPGLGSNGQAPGLNVQLLGGSAYVRGGGVRPYAANGFTYIALDLGFNLGASTGPQHLVFTTPGFLHILPAGVILTQNSPPQVSAASVNPEGTVTVTGKSWAPDSQIYFDGFPAAIASLDARTGSAVVTPPPGSSLQTSAITIYNSDGQSSQLVQSGSPVTFTYPEAATPLISSVSPSSLPAGAEAAIEITTANMNLVDGLITVGFGTSDVTVRQVFLVSPGHLRVNVSVAPGASLSNPDVSVISGFQLASAPAGFQILPAVKGLPAPEPLLPNAIPGLNSAYAGAIVSLYGANLAVANGTPVIAFNGQAATILYASPTQINLQIPQGLTSGLATLTLNNGVLDSFPLAVSIATQPAAITAVSVDAAHPAHRGDAVTITVSGTPLPGNVQVSVGDVLHSVLQTTAVGDGYQIVFRLNADEAVGAQTLIVYLDGRSSYPGTISVTP